MLLEAMIVSRDWQEVAVLECILNDLHVGVIVHQDVGCAQQRLSKSKIDALILDRDLGGSERLLGELPANNGSAPVILLSRSAYESNLPASGATFFFEKPISVEQAVRTLSATRNLMMTGHLRYQRQQIHVPVALRYGNGRRITAELENLSSGGLSLRASEALDRRGPISIRFNLPGLKHTLKIKGELAWSNNRGYAGIRFLQISQRLEQSLQQWLGRRHMIDLTFRSTRAPVGGHLYAPDTTLL
ncbi:MAG: PilZ domain-containing protein [Acidobacteria bacterium]|nr:PilZ domain-containing protein [Acidobacteriota bacterium]MBV9479939.1 PilZ domain-containing protein [Acidobacteriota bacterium]